MLSCRQAAGPVNPLLEPALMGRWGVGYGLHVVTMNPGHRAHFVLRGCVGAIGNFRWLRRVAEECGFASEVA